MSEPIVSSQSEPDRTFSSILGDAMAITGATSTSLYRLDPAAERVIRITTRGDLQPLQTPPWTPLGVGLIGRCAASGETILSPDIASDERAAYYWALKDVGIHAAVAVPIKLNQTTIGVLGAMHPEPGYFTADVAARLQPFVDDVAPTFQRLWTWQDRGASLSQVGDPSWLYQLRLERVRELGAQIHRLDDIEQIYECAISAMAELTWASRVFIALVDDDAGVIRAHRGFNMPPGLMAETVRRLYTSASPDEDILAYVVRTRQPAFTRLGDPRLNRETAAQYGGSRFALTVPLIGRSGVLGTVTAGWNHDALDDPVLLGIASILADHLTAAMDKHSLVQSERRQRLIAEELHLVAQRITAGLSLEDALDGVLYAVEKLLGAASASVYCTETSGLLPERRYTTRYTGKPHWEDRRGKISEHGPTATTLRTRKPVVVADLQSDPDLRQYDAEPVRTVAAVPIRYDDRIIGVLYANWGTQRTCGPSEIGLLETLASYGAIAIENARLHAHLVEEARLEEANRRAQDAEEAHRRLQEFMAMVSHDLRGPLTIAVGYAQVLRQRADSEGDFNEQFAARGLEKAMRRMWHIMDDLLDAARIGAGQFRVQPVPMNLADVIRQSAADHQATMPNHRLLVECPDQLPGCWDEQRITQVLSNLIANAVKYAPNSEIRVVARSTDDQVVIDVSDRGPGINPTERTAIFQPFFRTGSSRGVHGTGLGLYIAKGIVESHGGRISVQSEVGQGTTFTVALPLYVAPRISSA